MITKENLKLLEEITGSDRMDCLDALNRCNNDIIRACLYLKKTKKTDKIVTKDMPPPGGTNYAD